MDGHRRLPDRDGHAVHAVQGRVQREVEPAELGHDQMLKPVHRNRRVHLSGRGKLAFIPSIFSLLIVT